MKAQAEYDAQIGPAVEKYFTAKGVPFSLIKDGGTAMTDDETDGELRRACEPRQLGDGNLVTYHWGMTNFTYYGEYGFSIDGRGGRAMAGLEFRRANGEFVGSIEIHANHNEWHRTARDGQLVKSWQPVSWYVWMYESYHWTGLKAPAMFGDFRQRLEIKPNTTKQLSPEQGGRLVLALAGVAVNGKL